MADFCKQCSEELFGEDFGDFANITTIEQQQNNLFVVVLCEGCGAIQVDNNGRCVSNCSGNHHDRR